MITFLLLIVLKNLSDKYNEIFIRRNIHIYVKYNASIDTEPLTQTLKMQIKQEIIDNYNIELNYNINKHKLT